MSEEVRLVCLIALKAVLSAARSLRIDTDELCEAALTRWWLLRKACHPRLRLPLLR